MKEETTRVTESDGNMAAAAATRAFWDGLERCDLIDRIKVARVRKAAVDRAEAEVAAAFVRSGDLTAFQANELLAGRWRALKVSHFILRDILGYGGMGTVYVAWDRNNEREVALKVLADRFKHEAGMRARFRLEAEAGIKLVNDRLVRTYELGVIADLYGDTDFMAMELFKGVTLLEGINFSGGPIKHYAACDIVCQAAEGLHFLHERGMIHRDVKPDNILVDRDGTCKLLDFGLTLADQTTVGDEFSLAMIFGHDCLGTADFISPEQSQDSLNIDRRADVYSLGCSLYVALTARRPFPAPTRAETIKLQRTAPRPRIDAINTQAPTELANIVEKMMAVDPAQRPADMLAVQALLKPFALRRRWTFEFDEVLKRRQRRGEPSRGSRTGGEALRPTALGTRAETDPPRPNRRPPEGI